MPISKEHELDVLLVRNIDVGCDGKSADIVKTTRRVKDPENGTELTEYVELTDEFNHEDYFQVKWGGAPIRVAPGQTRKMNRFVAEHYAKHLADHILAKREIDENKPGLINHPVERPKVLEQIIIGVDSQFNDLGMVDEGTQALQQFESLNRSAVAAEMGMGGGSYELPGEVNAGVVSRDHFKPGKEIKSTEEILAVAAEQPEVESTSSDERFANKTRGQLFAEIRQMDPTYSFTGKETKDQLIGALQRF